MQTNSIAAVSAVSVLAPVLAAGILGNDVCTQGPSFWCASNTNAVECSFQKPEENCVKYCKDLVDSPFCADDIEVSLPEESPVLGADPCTWGPSYWCASSQNAKECNMESPAIKCQAYCAEMGFSPFCENLPGSDPCTRGPSYWCASTKNANECHLTSPMTECARYCDTLEDSPFCM